jgi:hypothetical protein
MSKNEKLLKELLDLVRARLRADADAADAATAKWAATLPTTAPKDLALMNYALAKAKARDGDLESLRKIVVDRMGDSGIAEFIAQPRRPKHVRRDYTRKPLEISFRRAQFGTVRRIRAIIKEETGRAPEAQVVKIAAAVLECSQNEVRELIKRGDPRHHIK